MSSELVTLKEGDKIGAWTIIAKAERRNKQARWLCRCDCGVVASRDAYSLKSGDSKSCGCVGKVSLSHTRERVKANSKRWREQNPEQARLQTKMRDLEKRRARNKTKAAVAKGILVKPAQCDLCSEPKKLQAHHPDYSKPLDVEWLCQLCHGLRHRTTNGKGSLRFPRSLIPARKEDSHAK